MISFPSRRISPIVAAAAFLFFNLTANAPSVIAQRAAPPADPLERMNESIDALTRKVWPSVVQILVTSYGPREGSRGDASAVVGKQRAIGSGLRDRSRRLHHDKRTRCQRRSTRSSRAPAGQRGRNPGDSVVRRKRISCPHVSSGSLLRSIWHC